MFTSGHAVYIVDREGQRKKKRSLLPFRILPCRWPSWWPPTRPFLFAPFLPPHRGHRLRGGHGKASLLQKGGCCNCSLRICKPRCPSEAQSLRRNAEATLSFRAFPRCRWQVKNPVQEKKKKKKMNEEKNEYVFSSLRLICQWQPSSESLQFSLLISSNSFFITNFLSVEGCFFCFCFFVAFFFCFHNFPFLDDLIHWWIISVS